MTMTMELVTAARFKLLHSARDPRGRLTKRSGAPLVAILKETAEPAEPAGERMLRFTISTGAVDRDQDKIDQTGWDLSHYRKNPVVLWSHQPLLLPIGKAEIAQGTDRLTATVKFLPAEGYGTAGEFADQVYRLARDGWLSATSVGFRPLQWEFTTDKERGAEDWFPGIDYQRQELCELSLCNVPSNPEALIEIEPLGIVAPPAAVAASYARDRRRRALAVIEAG